MATPTVIRLCCQGCGGTLHGTPQAVLFWCGDCHAVQEVVDGRLVPRQVQTAQAVVHTQGRPTHLPVWAFRVRAAWTWPKPAGREVAGWSAPEWVYVTAFALSSGFYFGDPGLMLTQRRAALTAGEPAPLLGGTRSLEEAKRFVEPHILSLLDRRVDVTGVTLNCTIDEVVLWGIPYCDDGLTLVDGLIGLKLPGAALDEIGALRAWWERRR